MPKIMLISNCERVTQIQLPSAAQRDPNRKDPTVPLGSVFEIRPGLNLKDVAEWEVAKKNPVTQGLLKTRIRPTPAPEQNPEKVGQFMLVEGKVVPDENPLAALKPAQAARMIEETLDTTLLRAWLQQEKRHDLRKAIDRQIDAIENPSDLDRDERGGDDSQPEA